MAAEESSRHINFGIRLGTETTARELDAAAPFRIAVLGDFSGRAQRGVDAGDEQASQLRPQYVDRDNFEQVMQQLDVRLERLLIAADRQPISLQLQTLEDFEPDVLFDKLAPFAALRDLRDRLLNPDTFDGAAQEILNWSTAPKDAAALETQDSLVTAKEPDSMRAEHLLDQILDDAQRELRLDSGQIELQVERLVAEIASPYALPAVDPRQSELVNRVDSAIQAIMLAILQHPSFKQLEADWRALRRLVFSLETDASLKVYLIDVSKAELANDVLNADDLTQTRIYRQLVEQTVLTPGGKPWSVLAASYYFGPDAGDVSLLGRLSKIAAAAGAPIVAGADGSVVGCPQPQTTPDPVDWQPAMIDRWQALRDLPEASYLGLIWPRFLLRLPYGESTNPTDRFALEEVSGAVDRRRLLWGNPAYLFATVIGQAFTRSGWSLALDEVREIDDLPVWLYREEGESYAHPCGEVLLREKAISQVSACGVMPLISIKDEPTVRIGGFHSVRGTPLQGRWS